MALRAVLIEENAKPATINHVLSAIRGVTKEAWRLGLIDAETKERIVDVKSVSASTLPAGRHVDVGEVRRLFETCGDTPVGARDAAMLALLYGCAAARSLPCSSTTTVRAPSRYVAARGARNGSSTAPPAGVKPSWLGSHAAVLGRVR